MNAIDPRVVERMIEPLMRRLTTLEAALANLSSVDVARPIGAIYATNAGQSIPTGGTGTVIDFEDLVYDPDGLVTTGAAWAFTVPITGLYAVSAAVLYANTTTWAAIEAALLSVYLDGTLVRHLCRQTDFSTANINAWNGGSTLVLATAGQAINIRAFQNSGDSLALINAQAYNHVSIWKVN